MLNLVARHLLVYFGAGGSIVWLARRYVQPISLRMSVFLLLIPLTITGKAVFSGRTYAPIDISYQTDPLRSMREGLGIGDPADPILIDLVAQRIPWQKAIRESVRNGHLPIWNRFSLTGEPLLAVMQSAVLHPFVWIGALLPLDQAWTLEMSLGVLLALLSAFVLMSDLGVPGGAALLGAIGWAFCDYLVFYAGWALSPAAAVFPLLLLGLLRIAVGRRVNGAGIMIAALTLCLLAGHPETALHAVFGGGIWFLLQLSGTPRGSRWKAVAVALGAGIVAACLTAIVLLPHLEALPQTVEYVSRSMWWVHQHKATPFAQSLSTMQQAIVPYALGVPGFGNMATGAQVPQAYLGSVLLPFAAIGLLSSRREKWACVVLAVVGFGAWSHVPILTDAIASLPLLDMALNERLVFLGCMAVALLAALGGEVLAGRQRLALAMALAGIGIVTVVFSSSLGRLATLGMPKDFRTLLFLAQTIPLLLVALVWVLPGRRKVERLTATAVILLGQRFVEAWHVYPAVSRAAFYPHVALLDPIPRGAPYRMAALGMAFIPNVSAMYEVEDVRGHEAMTFLPLWETYPLWCVQQPVFFNRVDDPSRPFLSFLNVRYVLAAPGVETPAGWPIRAFSAGGRLVENPNALARAFIPRQVEARPDGAERLAALAAITDFGQQGVVSEWRGRESAVWRSNGAGKLSITEYDGNELRADVDVTDELVVGTSIPAWKGWQARLDGVAIPLLRYNHAFLGIAVPAGFHRLEFRYRPMSLVIGAAMSLGTMISLLMAGWRRRIANRRRAPDLRALGEKRSSG